MRFLKDWREGVRSFFLTLLLASICLFLYEGSAVSAASVTKDAERISRLCQKEGGDRVEEEECIAKEFSLGGEERGMAYIGDLLTAFQGLDNDYERYQSCHVLAHRITNELTSRHPEKWKDLLAGMNGKELDPTRCGGGFMHGVIEGHSVTNPDFKVDANVFRELCTEVLPIESASSCAHILGHLALVEGLADVEESLKVCTGLTGDFLFQCYGGIFMEDSMRTNLVEHWLSDLPTKNLDWYEKQLNRCGRYKDNQVISEGCWYDLPEVFAQTHGHDLGEVYEFCAQAPNPEAYNRCYIRASYLMALAPEHIFKDAYYLELCSAYGAGTKERSRCIQSVVGAPLSDSVLLIDRTVKFCDAQSSQDGQECYKSIANHIIRAKLTSQEKKKLCNKLPDESQQACEI